MITIHIFNPDHDLALAANQERFTAPHAGRQLRSDLGFLPALYAKEGDIVLVDDIDAASYDYHKLKFLEKKNIEFATFQQLAAIQKSVDDTIEFSPWGWNKTLRFQLLQAGVDERLLPSVSYCDMVRQLSSRTFASSALGRLMSGNVNALCGESHYCCSMEEAEHYLRTFGNSVVKAPWSSSGRGVRYVLQNEEERHLRNTWNWMHNVMKVQGGVMVEPYYNKVKDFALEFYADGKGSVDYCGISLFETVNGAYTGNILATEAEKSDMLSRYVSLELLQEVVKFITQNTDLQTYCGPFGVDMMIVANPDAHQSPSAPNFFLHPCVEINMRRTMGHVALGISPELPSPRRIMRISYSSNQYHLSIKQEN